VTLLLVTRLLQGCAAALAVMIARRRADHRPLAIFLVGVALANLIRAAIATWVLTPDRLRADVPLTGALRVAGHLEHALFLSWPAGLAALVLVLYARRSPWPGILAWAGAVAVLVVSYPAVRGHALQRFYLAAHLLALAACVASIGGFVRRGDRGGVAHVCALLCVLAEGGTLLVGPWRSTIFNAWDLAQVAYATLYGVLIALQGGTLWTNTSSSSA